MKKTLILLSFLIFPFSNLFSGDYTQNTKFCKAHIDNIEKTEKEENGSQYTETVFSLRILTGENKGQIKTVTYKSQDSSPNYVKYRKGDTIFIGFNEILYEKSKDEYISLYDVDNSKGLIAICVIAIITLVAVARLRGIFSVMGLSITVMLIFFFFIPLTLKGYPPLLLALAVAAASIFMTIPFITGISKKTATAIIGAISGITVALLLSLAFGWSMHLSGIINDELLTVFYVTTENINLRDVALAGMILSALGAVIDISVSISSAVNEFFVVHPDVDFKTAFKSAMKVGHDNLGSMVNTLIMAYVGSSLSLLLIIYIKYDSTMPLSMIFSHNEIFAEILKSFVGCMGMLIAVPVTALAGVKINMRKTKSSAKS